MKHFQSGEISFLIKNFMRLKAIVLEFFDENPV